MVDPDIEQQMAKFAPSSNPSIDTGSDIDPDAAAIAKAVLPQGANEVDRVGPPNIDPDAAAIANAKQNALRSTMYGVAGRNPDQAAEAQRIGREFGVSGDFVLRNMEDMRRMQAIRSVERRNLMQQDPILARFLTNQDFAALAHDDLDNLSATERIYKGAVDFVNPKSWDTIRGRYQRGQDLIEMGRANDMMGIRAQWSPSPRDSAAIAEEIRLLPTDGGLIGSAAEVIGQMVAGIPEVAETAVAGSVMGGAAGAIGGPLAPASVPAGMVAGFTAGLGVGLVRVASMSEGGNALQEMRQTAYTAIDNLVAQGYSREQATKMVGYDDATAQKFAIGVGILNGIIEAASFEVMGPVARRLVGNLIREKVSEAVIRPTMRGAIMQFAKDYSKAVVAEGGEEFFQQWVGIIGDEMQRKYGSNLPSRFNDEGSIKAAIGESFDAAIEGMKGAMLIGGVGPTGNLYFDMQKARNAVRQQAFFSRLTDAAKNSKVRQRDTPAYEKFIEGQVEGTKADTVYIDAHQLNGVLRQAESTGIARAEELDQLLPGVRQQLAEALETNGDVTVPMSVWQARVAGTKVGDALFPHVRLSADAWSINDRMQWENKRASLMQEAEELLDEQEKKDTKARSAAAQIEDSIKEQLVQSGAMDEKAASANAKFYRSMIVVMADRVGMTPEQFNERFGMRVFGATQQQTVDPLAAADQFDQSGKRNIDTPQFAAWNNRPADQGGANKLNDASGKPIKVYHGAPRGGFNAFDPNRIGSNTGYGRGGFSFTTNEQSAQAYAYDISTENAQITDMVAKANMVFSQVKYSEKLEKEGLWVSGDPEGYPEWDSTAPEGIDDLIRSLEWAAGVLRMDGQEAAAMQLEEVVRTTQPPVPEVYEAYVYVPQNTRELTATRSTLGQVLAGVDVRREPARAIIVNLPNDEKVVIVATPSDIKSTDNSGAFNRLTDNIYEQAETVDAAYKAAVERGDMATAQRIVDELAERAMQNSKVRDANGKLLKIYHGSNRIDRVGNRLLKNRSASGPMPFFTDNRDLAEKYAQGKIDTSIEDTGYETWFKYKPRGARAFVDLDRAWSYLTPEQRATATERLFTVGYQNADEGTGPIVSDSQSIASDDHVAFMLRQARGNALTAAKELWLNSGALINDEQQFMDVLSGMGLGGLFEYESPHVAKPGLVEAYANITNPLDTTAVPAEVVDALQARADKTKRPTAAHGRDFWDKTLRDPQEWMAVLREDIATGRQLSWTSIPDWVTDVLKDMGYDGIKDTSGKYSGGPQHQVWIPFEPNQIKFAQPVVRDGSRRIVPVSKRFDLTSPMMFKQASVSTSFYSALSRAVVLEIGNDLPVEGWMQRIQGLINKGTIKEAEVEWSGLREWLQGFAPRMANGRIAMMDVKRFLDDNGVEIEVKRYATPNVAQISMDAASQAEDDLAQAGKLTDDVAEAFSSYRVLTEANADREELAESEGIINKALMDAFGYDLDEYMQNVSESEVGVPKFENWTMPGGENYREVLIKIAMPRNMPTKVELRRQLLAAYDQAPYEQRELLDQLYFSKFGGGGSFGARLSKMPDYADFYRPLEGVDFPWVQKFLKDMASLDLNKVPGYSENHWSERAVVAHLRFKDRVDVDGNRVLFVEEVQSDWAEKGFDLGFKGQREEDQEAVAKLREEYKAKPESEVKARAELQARINRLQRRIDNNKYTVPVGPYVATTDAWVTLALKQVMLEAVNGRYDKVAIINGKQANKVFRLENVVEEMAITPPSPWSESSMQTGRQIEILLKNQRDVMRLWVNENGRVLESENTPSGQDMKGEFLGSIVGKELAERIMAIEPTPLDQQKLDERGKVFAKYNATLLSVNQEIADLEAYRSQSQTRPETPFGFQPRSFADYLASRNAVDLGNGNYEVVPQGIDPTDPRAPRAIYGEADIRWHYESAERYRWERLFDELIQAARERRNTLEDQLTAEADAVYKLPEQQATVLKEKGLRVGGAGMKIFYDSMVPTTLKKLLQKVAKQDPTMVDFAKTEGVTVLRQDVYRAAMAYAKGDLSAEEVIEEAGLEGLITPVEAANMLDQIPFPDPYNMDHTRAGAKSFADTIMNRAKGQRGGVNIGFDVTDQLINKVVPGLPLFQLPKFNLYSALAQQVAAMSDKPMSADTWNQQFNNLISKGLIKKDELEWSGLMDFLAGVDGKISKQAVLAYLNNEGVQITRVQLGQFQATSAAERRAANAFFEAFRERYGVIKIDGHDMYEDDVGFTLQDGTLTPEELPADLQELARRYVEAHQISKEYQSERTGPTAHGDPRWQLPGGKNYRELLLTLPRIPFEGYDKFVAEMQSKYGDEYRIKMNADETVRMLALQKQPKRYLSQHWKYNNVLVHIRVTDRVDADGKVVLFVEEIQSDWAQQARDMQDRKKPAFFAMPSEEMLAKRAKVRIELDKANQRTEAARLAVSIETRKALQSLGFATYQDLLATGDRKEELKAEYARLKNETESFAAALREVAAAEKEEVRLYDELASLEMPTGEYPAAPFVARQLFAVFKDGKEVTGKDKANKEVKQRYSSMDEAERAAKKVGGEARDIGMQAETEGWVNLALKQIVLEAIRGGYDRVAFINGEQTADRYDKSQYVSRIYLTDMVFDGDTNELLRGTLVVTGKNGSDILTEKEATPEKMRQIIGKEATDRLINNPSSTSNFGTPQQTNQLDGDGLKVGGEGLRAFYDRIVPAAANKLLDKLDGSKLQVTKWQMWDTVASKGKVIANDEIRAVALQYIAGEIDEEQVIDGIGLFDENVLGNNDVVQYLGNIDSDNPIAVNEAVERFVEFVQTGHGMTNQFAFDITPELRKRVAEQGGLPLFQAAPLENARGGFDPRRMAMLLGEKADLSTFLHESAHWYLTVLSQLASMPTASEQIKADMNTLLGWFGVADLAAWNRMTLNEQRVFHEQFAYNFELYINEGVAPSLELQGMFERFSAWLKRVYVSIRDELNAIYVREYGQDLPMLTGEVRQVMDRMIASEEQIKRAESVRQMKPMFLTQEESGMDDATWAAYQKMVEEATQAAVTDMTKASVKQMQWLSGARDKILREIQSRNRKVRQQMRQEVAERVRRSPLYRAMAFVRTGESINPDGTAFKSLGAHRLDMEAVRQMYPAGTENIPDLEKLGTGGRGMMGMNGLHPDTVAEMFGYSSGDELVRALIAAKPMREEVNRITDERMLKEHGDLTDPDQVEHAIQKALHNEARARFVGVELRFVAKATEPVRVMVTAAKEAAKDIIGRKRLRDIKTSNYESAESRAAMDAKTAYNTKQTPEQVGKAAFTRAFNEAKDNGADDATATATATAKAAQAIARAAEKQKQYQEKYGNRSPEEVIVRAKRAQLINNQLAAQAVAVTDEIAKKVKYLRRVLRDDNVKKMGAEHADQIAQLLENFDLAQRSLKAIDNRVKFAAWLESKRAEGIEPEIPADLVGAERMNYRNMTLNQFRDLVAAVQQIEFMGKNARTVMLAAQRKQFEQERDEIVASIEENSRGRKARARAARNASERRTASLKGFLASHLNAATIVRILDGGKDNGKLWNYLIRTANERADMETTMRAKATERLAQIFKPILAKDSMGGKGMKFDSVGESLNLESRLGIALNMGNAGNIQRLLDGEGWTMQQLMPVLQSLTSDQWNAVQEVWDYLETFRPLIAEKERRIYGKEPDWVEPQPLTIVTKDGKTLTLRGGYYPIKYDPRASRRSESLELADQAKRDMASAFTSSTTRRSFTKNRAERVTNRPLLYTLDAMYNGLSEVIHDLAWHEWLIDANRLMRSDKFDAAIRNTYGDEFLSQLNAWIKDVAAGEKGSQHALEAILGAARRNISVMSMGVNALSAALQVTGFSQSFVRVGAKWVGRAMSKSLVSPKQSNQFVNAKSEFMANRGRTQFREIAEIKNMIREESGLKRSMQANAYVMMLFMQRTVDVPTWIGAYEKARAEAHDEATAVALADQAVIDSQGSGMLKDLSRIQRGGEFIKVFTMFYSFMNTTFNLAAVSAMTRNKGRMMAEFTMLFVVPVLMTEALKRLLVPKRDDEPEDPAQLARELAAAELSYVMGTMVGVRELSDALPRKLFGLPSRGYSGPAGLRTVSIIPETVGEVMDFEADRNFRKSVIQALGAWQGIPATQINRTIDGLQDIAKGKTHNPAAVIFGTRK